MNNHTDNRRCTADTSRNLRQAGDNSDDRQENQPPYQPGNRTSTDGSVRGGTMGFRVPIEWIAFDKYSHPKCVSAGVNYAYNQYVPPMSYERSKQLLTVLIRPVQAASLPERHEGHRPQKPPENAVTKSPSQARSIPANITLKEQPKGGADDECEDKM